MVEEQNKAVIQHDDTLSQPSIPEERSSSSKIAESNGEQKKEDATVHSTLTKLEETKRKVFKTNKRKNAKMDEGTRLFLRRERDKIRQRLARMHEDEDKRKLRLEKDKMRKRISRQMENDFERLRRRDKDRERQALKRKFEKEQRDKKRKCDNDFDERVSMVDIGSTIVIKDTQIAENLDEEIEVTVEVADEERFKEIKVANDHRLEKVKEVDHDHGPLEEVTLSDNQNIEVVKLADGVCIHEIKVTEDHRLAEDDFTRERKDSLTKVKNIGDDNLVEGKVTQKKLGEKVSDSEEAANLESTDDMKDKLKESMDTCVEKDTNNSKELKKSMSAAKSSK